MKSRLTPDRAVLLGMLFFLTCAAIWALRVPIENGVPISFNSDEPSHYLVVRYIAQHWSLPPYTRDYYESAHPPLSDWIQACYVRLWPESVWVYALRFLSTAFGLGTLFLIYRTAKPLVSPWTAALATCLTATLPMFIMFSSSVTNDGLAVLLSTATLHIIVKSLRYGMSKRQLNWLCVFVGLAGIAKYTCLGLLPVSIGMTIYERKRTHKNWIVAVLSIVATFVLISGWWYMRNQMLYGDAFRSKAEADMGMFTGTGAPTRISYWVAVGTTMLGSFLGMYPSFPVWPLSVYDVCVTIVGLIMLSGIWIAARRRWTPIKVVLAAYLLSVLLVVLQYQINHFEPHGRLLSPAIMVIMLGLIGIRHAIPDEKRAFVGTVAVCLLACLSIALVTSSI